jgi:hypothetical protein
MESLNLSQFVVQVLSKNVNNLSVEQTAKLCRVFLQKLVLGNSAPSSNIGKSFAALSFLFF